MSASASSDSQVNAGPGRIGDARTRQHVSVVGTVGAAGTVTVGGSPAYRCVLSDGTGQLDLVFLGHRTVGGLTAGKRCRVAGVVTTRCGRLTIWNPRYEIWPDEEIRPDVERAADGVEAAGHFRIYLGVAAGVGKTIAMLGEGHRRRDRGADVVVAFAESHGRPLTEARMTGLEAIPRLTVEYHGTRFEEMDTQAVLRRRPAVALVDELAHTNVPESGRHSQRWQDVLELLDAGIDVITTVNVQHLESIADAVERITRVRVGERVPDWMIRRADQIELIDSSPEQLRRRMLHGNIYPAEQIPGALTHFFRTENLAALRELALRFLAGEAGEELTAAERIMVGVNTALGTDAIIRRAARMAARIKAKVEIVHVTDGDMSRDDRLASLRQVASDVGATWHQVEAEDPVSALIDFARTGQITQIVVGSSQRRRWQELASGGSIVMRVTRLAGRAGIDVHIVAQHEPTTP